MADAAQVFGIVAPANTNGFNTYSHVLPLCTVERILVTWPPGCAGLVQVKLMFGGNIVYPAVQGQAFEFDDYTLDLTVSNQGNSGSWGAEVANFDSISHTIHVSYLYNYWVDAGSSSSSLAVSL